MVERLVSKPTTLTRAELGVIFKTPKAIKAFEDLQQSTGIQYVEIINGVLDALDAIDAAPPPPDVSEALHHAAFALEAISNQLAAVREGLADLRSAFDNILEGPL